MNLTEVLKGLRQQLAAVDAAIEKLEGLQGTTANRAPAHRSNRGRKFMGAAERREVSERMKQYWASRRKAQAATA